MEGLFSEFYGLHCITCMIIMSDILKFQIIFTLTSEQYNVCNLSRLIRKESLKKLCPTFQAIFMVIVQL